MTTWRSDQADAERAEISALGWVRVILRGLPIFVVLGIGLGLSLALQLIERPLFAPRRPWTPWITRVVCRLVVALVGIRFTVQGTAMRGQGALVANHTSWFDIFVLNAADCVYFVSKSEVSGWPGIGLLAKVTGTVFISRVGAEAAAQKTVFEDRLSAEHKLLFFPEGAANRLDLNGKTCCPSVEVPSGKNKSLCPAMRRVSNIAF